MYGEGDVERLRGEQSDDDVVERADDVERRRVQEPAGEDALEDPGRLARGLAGPGALERERSPGPAARARWSRRDRRGAPAAGAPARPPPGWLAARGTPARPRAAASARGPRARRPSIAAASASTARSERPEIVCAFASTRTAFASRSGSRIDAIAAVRCSTAPGAPRRCSARPSWSRTSVLASGGGGSASARLQPGDGGRRRSARERVGGDPAAADRRARRRRPARPARPAPRSAPRTRRRR